MKRIHNNFGIENWPLKAPIFCYEEKSRRFSVNKNKRPKNNDIILYIFSNDIRANYQ